MPNGSSLPAPLPASSGTHSYYVNFNTGNDSTGTGAIGFPWKTLDHASGVAVAGDIIYVRGGNYGVTGGDATRCFFDATGSSSNPITVVNYPGEVVTFWMQLVIDSANYVNFTVDYTGGGNWIFKTNIYSGSPGTTTLASAIATAPPAGTVETWTLASWPTGWNGNGGAANVGFLKVDNEYLKLTDSSPRGGTTVDVIRGFFGSTPATHMTSALVYTGDTAIYVKGTSSFIDCVGHEFQYVAKNAYFVESGTSGIQLRNGYAHQCGSRDNIDHGYYWQPNANANNSRNLIANCIFTDFPGYGGQTYHSSGVVDTVIITGNLAYNCKTGFLIAVNGPTGTTENSKNVTERNNIALNCAEFGFRTSTGAASTGNTLDSNLASGNPSGNFGDASTDQWNSSTNQITSDPLCTNPAGGDFTIPSGSPARGVANIAYATVTDKIGATRDSTPDIGPYEYVAVAGVTNARLSQAVIEVLERPTTAGARLSQALVEVLEGPTDSKARVSQMVIEVLRPSSAPAAPITAKRFDIIGLIG